MNLSLKRFWFNFYVNENLPSMLNLGCGVTAYDLEDALSILSISVFNGKSFKSLIKNTVEGVDVSTLDQNHIIPNMLPPNRRGIWFPIGYY